MCDLPDRLEGGPPDDENADVGANPLIAET
jgi:hypothetical protein